MKLHSQSIAGAAVAVALTVSVPTEAQTIDDVRERLPPMRECYEAAVDRYALLEVSPREIVEIADAACANALAELDAGLATMNLPKRAPVREMVLETVRREALLRAADAQLDQR
ncbi:MAG: hypothetical protein K5872_08760 [Rhizobiaceae bacterium]|nr:hypothetical protein [Rhizobiaceae bacterium]